MDGRADVRMVALRRPIASRPRGPSGRCDGPGPTGPSAAAVAFGWVGGWTGGWMEGWRDSWTEGLMDGWMVGGMDAMASGRGQVSLPLLRWPGLRAAPGCGPGDMPTSARPRARAAAKDGRTAPPGACDAVDGPAMQLSQRNGRAALLVCACSVGSFDSSAIHPSNRPSIHPSVLPLDPRSLLILCFGARLASPPNATAICLNHFKGQSRSKVLDKPWICEP